MTFYTVFEPNTDFIRILQTLQIDLEASEQTGFTAEAWQQAGLNPTLLTAIQAPDSRDLNLDATEQAVFVGFYRTVVPTDADPEKALAEFKRLTATDGPWLTSPYYQSAYDDLQSMKVDLLHACVAAYQPLPSHVVFENFRRRSEIRNVTLAQLHKVEAANPFVYSYCPVDPTRPDLQTRRIVNAEILPESLRSKAQNVQLVSRGRRDSATGTIVYLGDGYFVSARHVVYPTDDANKPGKRKVRELNFVRTNLRGTPTGDIFKVPEDGIEINLQSQVGDLVVVRMPFRLQDENQARLNLASLPKNPKSWLGQRVIHIGFGNFPTVAADGIEKLATYGTITGIDLEKGLLITDAPVAPGSSGGLLMLEDGTVIGIASGAGLDPALVEAKPDGSFVASYNSDSRYSVFGAIPFNFVFYINEQRYWEDSLKAAPSEHQ